MRVVLITALAALSVALTAGGVAASPVPGLGGQCDGVVDVSCRTHRCQPDELDCGLVPPCVLWVAGTCLY